MRSSAADDKSLLCLFRERRCRHEGAIALTNDRQECAVPNNRVRRCDAAWPPPSAMLFPPRGQVPRKASVAATHVDLHVARRQISRINSARIAIFGRVVLVKRSKSINARQIRTKIRCKKNPRIPCTLRMRMPRLQYLHRKWREILADARTFSGCDGHGQWGAWDASGPSIENDCSCLAS